MTRSTESRAARETDARRGRLFLLLALVVVVAVSVMVMTFRSSGGEVALAPVELQIESDEHLAELAQGEWAGPEDAPVTIIEFGDYQCPSCSAFATRVKPQLLDAFVEPGHARFVFYDFPLVGMHDKAFVAARAARCAADQDGFWPFHDRLFSDQLRWATQADATERFFDYARELGIDDTAFEACLQSDRHAEVVSANLQLALRMGVDRTPTVLVAGPGGVLRRVGSDFASISAAVEEMMAAGG